MNGKVAFYFALFLLCDTSNLALFYRALWNL